jgi:glycosyltransferase involved in cell wall biosynthesis
MVLVIHSGPFRNERSGVEAMKVLMIDKFYFIKGGAERYYFELKDVLEAKGHKVIPFSMKHPENFDTEYEEFFVDNIEYNVDSFLAKIASIPRITARMIYSTHAKERLEKLLEHAKPDIAHLHMIDHQLSPSILHTLKKYDIPVLQTIHQYKLVCPNYRLYNPKTNEICEKCLGGHYFNPIFQKCHKNSTIAGAMIALESYVHHLMRIYEKNVDIFHTPSHFMTDKLKAGGIHEDKIKHLFYTLKLDNYPPHFEFDDYVVYLGRLAKEKGVLTLLQAMTNIRKTQLLVVGDGPQRNTLEQYAAEQELSNVTFLGNQSGEKLQQLIQKAKFLVVPSEWYDNSPLVIYEAFAYGKPVIGSRLGGISELIDDEKNGCHFTAGNVEELTQKIEYLTARPEKISEFGHNARRKAESEFEPEYHFGRMYDWYNGLLSTSNRNN